jgi:hypothetical protein
VSLPVLYDPFSRLGDEIAGTTPDELVINFAHVCRLGRQMPRGAVLHHEPPNLRRLFHAFSLGTEARLALAEAQEILRAAQRRDAA